LSDVSHSAEHTPPEDVRRLETGTA
jgi:hypothetical protein